MECKLPSKADLPSSLTIDIIPPPQHDAATNVLILLHGLGDSQAPFAQFARSMRLPETAALSICGPVGLPFDLGGFHWGDDMLFDQATGETDVDAGFKRSLKFLVEDVITKSLCVKCGYKPRQIVLFGFGQGGMLALSVAAEMNVELGGVISIGGELPSSSSIPEVGKKSKIPILICKSKVKSAITEKGIARLKDTFEFVSIREFSKSGDSMPSNREEILPIMQFFGQRLLSTKGIPKGSIPIS